MSTLSRSASRSLSVALVLTFVGVGHRTLGEVAGSGLKAVRNPTRGQGDPIMPLFPPLGGVSPSGSFSQRETEPLERGTPTVSPPACVDQSSLALRQEVPPAVCTVTVPAWMDRNGNRVADALERSYGRARKAGLQALGDPPAADLMICLDHAPVPADLAHWRALGATVLEAWSEPVPVVRVRLPAAGLSPDALERLGRVSGVVWVEENAVGRAAGYFAHRQTRARAAWVGGLNGSPNQSIAFLDTGIDATHPDFAGRLLGWIDFAGTNILVPGDESLTPVDRNGHGTAVAGLAAGDGSAAEIASGIGYLNITYATPLTFAFPPPRFFPVDTLAATGARSLTARLKWQAILPEVLHEIRLASDPTRGGALLGSAWTPASGPQPFALTVQNLPSGLFSFFFQATAGTSADAFPEGAGLPAWLQVSTPMSGVGDGLPLMRGVAPGCKIVAVKLLDDRGVTTVSTFVNAVSWLNANRRLLDLVCVNGSFSLRDGPSALMDTLVDQMVHNGVVWVSAAGDDNRNGVPSPGSAAKAITVGATNEADRVTAYSTPGRSGQGKPDLVAPGGSAVTGRSLVVADSNSADAEGVTPGDLVPDQFPNDYAASGIGTSFAAPQVAGAAMLVAQVMGPWTFTEVRALQVKSILLMTASETAFAGEGSTGPQLNRGGKDPWEGFGRLNTDAAVEAVLQPLTVGTPVTAALGPGVLDKKVWARNVGLTGRTTYTFALTNPASTDLDLYLYSDTPVSSGGSDGEPQIVAKSTRAALGSTELIQFTPTVTGRFYVVVKYVGGDGGAFLVSTSSTPDFALSITPGTQVLEAKGESVRYVVSVTGLGGFNSTVSLSVTGLPAGVTAQFNPASVSPGGASVLTISTSAGTPSGSLAFTIQGSAVSAARSVGARLEVGSVWPRFHHDGRSSGRSAFNGPQTPKQAWLHGLGSTPILSSPAIGGDGTLYYGPQDGRLRAVRPTDGAVLWAFEAGNSSESSPAVGIDGTIYFGADDGRLFALGSDGSRRWDLALGAAPVRSGPVLAPDGTIYVTAGGTLHAVRSDGTLKWSFGSGGTLNSSPALGADGTIYFGAGNATGTAADRLYAIRDTGTAAEKKWEFTALGNVLSTPALAPNGRIYFGASGDASSGRFYVLADAGTSATKVAEFSTGAAVRSSPAIGPDGSLYVGCDDSNLYAFNANGGLKWRFGTSGAIVSSPAVGGDGLIYIGSRDTRIYAVRDQGGSAVEVWRSGTGDEVLASPAIGANGALYVPSRDGSLYAFQDGATATFYAQILSTLEVGMVGETRNYPIRLRALNGFASSVSLQLAGTLPQGVTATFEPPTVTLGSDGTGQTTLRLASTSAAPAGEFPFRVRAVSGTITRETDLASLVLVDYTLVGQPAARRITAGQSATFSVALVPNPATDALNAAVGLTATVVSGPSGGTAPTFAFDANTVKLPALVTLTATTAAGTPAGAYVVEVRGAAGSATRTTRLRLEVAASP